MATYVRHFTVWIWNICRLYTFVVSDYIWQKIYMPPSPAISVSKSPGSPNMDTRLALCEMVLGCVWFQISQRMYNGVRLDLTLSEDWSEIDAIAMVGTIPGVSPNWVCQSYWPTSRWKHNCHRLQSTNNTKIVAIEMPLTSGHFY